MIHLDSHVTSDNNFRVETQFTKVISYLINIRFDLSYLLISYEWLVIFIKNKYI